MDWARHAVHNGVRLLPPRLRERQPWLVALLIGSLWLGYSTLVHDIVQNGDAAVYNEQIGDHILDQRPIHFGYILIGSAFHALLPFRTDKALNVMALTFGLGAAIALYATGRRWASRLAGLSCVLCALCSASFVHSMVLSEVDILSASLVIIAYAFCVHGRPVLAGLSFGLGMLSTPATLGMLPLFLLSFARDPRGLWFTIRVQARRVLWFGLAGLVAYAPWVLWHSHAYFYGSRGVFTLPYSGFRPREQALRCAEYFRDNAWALLPLFLAGLANLLSDEERWRVEQPAFGIVASVIFTALVVDRAGDVPVHLANVLLLSLVVALFVQRLAKATPWSWAIPCCAFLLMGIPAYLAERDEVTAELQQRRTYIDMRNQSLPLQAMLVDLPRGFSVARAFEHYAYGHCYTGLVLSLREFRRKLRGISGGHEEFVIYFVNAIPGDIRHALEKRYEPAIRTVNRQRYHALVPRSSLPAP